MIPYIDFGGAGPPLHFANANGYPPRAYGPFVETLTPRFHVLAMLTRPLRPECSPDELHDWGALAADLLQFLVECGEQPMIGVGHSVGGAVTLAAALCRPELFRALVLIDPVLISYPYLLLWTLAYKLGLGYRLHPLAPGALRRRRTFESVDAMYASYRRKAVFSRMSDRSLRAYVESLAVPGSNGQVELAYSPEWEARIYVTAALYGWKLWARMKELRPPLLVVRGAETDTFGPAAARMVRRRLPQATLHTVPDTGHLLPLEKPEEVGGVVHKFLERIA